MLQVTPEALAFLEVRSIKVYVLETRQAVGLYNDLAQSEAVGGLFHSTC
jgi:hypothetical protein